MRAHRIEGDPVVRFAGFLDGIQHAAIVSHHRGIPIVLGTVAAAIRVRLNRRMVTWGHRQPVVSRKLYLPLELLQLNGRSHAAGFEMVDMSRLSPDGSLVSRHPAALRAVAFERVGRERDESERQLAEAWCTDTAEPLFIDGGISGSPRVAASECAVGVIKTHAVLFAGDDSIDMVMALRRGERSSVFVLPSRSRSAVISWYLRLRDPRGHDAMFGLVRIEASVGGDVAQRANEISRWVMAEAAPLSLPDSRWDRMVYGIRDCEQFLRAIA